MAEKRLLEIPHLVKKTRQPLPEEAYIEFKKTDPVFVAYLNRVRDHAVTYPDGIINHSLLGQIKKSFRGLQGKLKRKDVLRSIMEIRVGKPHHPIYHSSTDIVIVCCFVCLGNHTVDLRRAFDGFAIAATPNPEHVRLVAFRSKIRDNTYATSRYGYGPVSDIRRELLGLPHSMKLPCSGHEKCVHEEALDVFCFLFIDLGLPTDLVEDIGLPIAMCMYDVQEDMFVHRRWVNKIAL